ncbi:MAG: BCCT family transporter [Myxococcota bacterium]
MSDAPSRSFVRTFWLSAGPLLGFALTVLALPEWATDIVKAGFSAITESPVGGLWQGFLLLYFVVAIGLAISPWGKAKLGGEVTPEMDRLRWLAVILCTLLAGGGVFWSAAEPMYHFTSPPPFFGASAAAGTAEMAPRALAQCHLHWGFLAWAVVGTLAAVAVSAARTLYGEPLRPRALLLPLLGRPARGWLGDLADAVSIIAVVAGTVGPIGFLALQLSYAAHELAGLPDALATRLVLLGALVLLYTASAASGLDKGIQWLSRLNVGLALGLGVVLLLVGPSPFVVKTFFSSMAIYAENIVPMALYRGDTGWLSYWTVFYWGWSIGYGSMMAIFVARVSRGRTVREVVLTVAIAAPLVTNLWFTALGGTGIAVDLASPGSVSAPLKEAGLGAALLATIEQLPGTALLVPAFLVLIFCFLATTGDSVAYTISVVLSGQDTPPKKLRIFWAVAMGVLAALLLSLGAGGIDALQQFIVVTALPVFVLLLPTLVTGPAGAHSLLQAERAASTADDPAPSA